MEAAQLARFHWSPPPDGQIVEFAAQTECSYLELIYNPASSLVTRLEGTLDDASLSSWFEKDQENCPPMRHGDGGEPPKKPLSRLRLLQVHKRVFILCTAEIFDIRVVNCELHTTRHVPEISFSKGSFAFVKDHLGLPDHYLSDITKDHIFRTSVFSSIKDGRKLQGLLFKVPFYRRSFHQLSISYDPNSCTTYAVFLGRNRPNLLPPLLARLISFYEDAEFAFHPLILIILGIERQINRASRRLHESDMEVNELEELMGQHEYSDRRRGNPFELDFTAATRKLNHVSKVTGVDALNTEFMMLAFETIDAWMINITRDGAEGTDIIGVTTCVKMQEKIIWLTDSCRSLLLLAEYEEKRTRTLIQVVYQYMAQRDAKINIELASSSASIARASKEDSAVMRQIAIEARRDSSAMKTIAVLGMFFLPGTFVAAIFAMPVFNWDGDQVPVVKKGFGYYWAVAAPLTVLVISCWAVSMLLPWRRWLARVGGKSQAGGRSMELDDMDAS